MLFLWFYKLDNSTIAFETPRFSLFAFSDEDIGTSNTDDPVEALSRPYQFPYRKSSSHCLLIGTRSEISLSVSRLTASKRVQTSAFRPPRQCAPNKTSTSTSRLTFISLSSLHAPNAASAWKPETITSANFSIRNSSISPISPLKINRSTSSYRPLSRYRPPFGTAIGSIAETNSPRAVLRWLLHEGSTGQTLSQSPRRENDIMMQERRVRESGRICLQNSIDKKRRHICGSMTWH